MTNDECDSSLGRSGNPRVSVLVPARDEAGNVTELVARVERAFAAWG